MSAKPKPATPPIQSPKEPELNDYELLAVIVKNPEKLLMFVRILMEQMSLTDPVALFKTVTAYETRLIVRTNLLTFQEVIKLCQVADPFIPANFFIQSQPDTKTYDHYLRQGQAVPIGYMSPMFRKLYLNGESIGVRHVARTEKSLRIHTFIQKSVRSISDLVTELGGHAKVATELEDLHLLTQGKTVDNTFALHDVGPSVFWIADMHGIHRAVKIMWHYGWFIVMEEESLISTHPGQRFNFISPATQSVPPS